MEEQIKKTLEDADEIRINQEDESVYLYYSV